MTAQEINAALIGLEALMAIRGLRFHDGPPVARMTICGARNPPIELAMFADQFKEHRIHHVNGSDPSDVISEANRAIIGMSNVPA